MDILRLNLTEESHRKLSILAIKVELFEGRRFRPAKHIDDLVATIQVAKGSLYDDVQSACKNLAATLTQDQLAFFRVVGCDMSGCDMGEPNICDANNKENSFFDHHPKSPKRKTMVYRGQVVQSAVE